MNSGWVSVHGRWKRQNPHAKQIVQFIPAHRIWNSKNSCIIESSTLNYDGCTTYFWNTDYEFSGLRGRLPAIYQNQIWGNKTVERRLLLRHAEIISLSLSLIIKKSLSAIPLAARETSCCIIIIVKQSDKHQSCARFILERRSLSGNKRAAPD